MADTDKPGTGSGTPAGSNTAVPDAKRDHDRVQMLSVRADGTPDQYDPEFIGPEDQTLAATQEQFKQQAVSARDTELRALQGAAAAGYTAEDAPQDPTVDKLQKAHEKTAKEAEQAAEKAVKDLRKNAEQRTSEAVDPTRDEYEASLAKDEGDSGSTERRSAPVTGGH